MSASPAHGPSHAAWKGGALTEINLALPRKRQATVRTDEATVALVRRLAVHYPDTVIAGILNRAPGDCGAGHQAIQRGAKRPNGERGPYTRLDERISRYAMVRTRLQMERPRQGAGVAAARAGQGYR